MKGFSEKFNGYAFIAFIDILGFKNEIEKFWRNHDDNPLKRILSIIKNVKKLDGNDVYSVMDDNRIEIETYNCKIKMFSDSFIVLFALKKDFNIIRGDELILGLLSVTQCVKSIWENCLKSGFTIRGGIELDEIYWDNDNVIGPGLINAFELEKNYAKTSRVIISTNIIQNIIEFNENEPFNKMLSNEFYKDIDGYIAINPNLIFPDEKKRYSIIIKLKEKQRILKEFAHREKYTPLIKILEIGDESINNSFNIFEKYGNS